MQRVATGSREALVVLIRRYQSPLLTFFTRLGVYQDGEDLVQETFVRLYRSRQQYRPSAKFSTYLYTLARAVWCDRCRKEQRRERVLGYIRLDVCIAEEAPPPEQRRSGMDIQDALAQLSPKLREVVVLQVYQGLRQREVADVLGIPLGTVKSRMNLALDAMRRWLDEAAP